MTVRNSVLIVDDDPGLRGAITKTLRSRGYVPMAASMVQEALDTVAKDTPTVALIDLRLEGDSGIDLLRAIKEQGWPTECIVLTGYASQKSAIEALNLGAYGYVQKPYDPEQLMMLIRGACDKRRAEEMLRERTVELGQRLKELHCLYSISSLIQRPGISLEEILQQSALLIPPAWRYSKVACARIILGKQEFQTPNFVETPWKQASHIIVHGEQGGAVEVCYLEEEPACDEGPFSEEERNLIDAIAERLGRIAERKRVEEALQRSQEAMARSSRLLLALSYASEAVQRARAPEEIYCTVLDEVVRLDYHALVFTLTEDRTHLALSYITAKSPLLRAAEELAGRSVVDSQETMEYSLFHIAIEAGDFHEQLIKSKQAVFVENMSERLLEDMPSLVHPLVEQPNNLAAEQGIYAPLVIGGETGGILVVNGIGLTKDDVPAVTAFANQIAIALERARLYQDMRESEERFRTMSASAQDAIIMADGDGKVSFWNEAAERIFDYSNQDAVGKQVHALLAPQRYHEAYRRVFERPATADEEPAVGGTFELTAMRRDGTEFPVEVSLSAVMLKSKWHTIGIIRDIAERKLAEEALRESEALYRGLFDGVPIGLYRSTPDGQQLDANLALVDMLGYPDRESLLETTSVDMYVDPVDRRLWQTLMERDKLVHDFEVQLRRRDGEIIWVRDVARTVCDAKGQTLYYEGSLADITERKQAERALRESEEQYRDLFENAHDLIQSVTPNGRLLYVNRAWKETMGYSDEEIADLSLFDVVHPDSRAHCLEILQYITMGRDARNVETTFVAKDGREIIVEGNASCRFKDGKPISTRGIFRDVTERKQAEEALRQYAAELEASNEELDAFAHTVAHDLKGPLGNLMGFAELLIESFGALPEDQIQECLQSIVYGSERMTNIINALLLLASVRKIEEVQVEPLDMAGIVAEVCDRLAAFTDEYQAEIITPDTWPMALGYAPWVEEVWVNYMSNAIKYGGRPPRVELGAEAQPEGEVHFWVRDNGSGISPEEQGRLFIPFTRLSQIQVKGHGLGLSIVRRIVEKLGGQVAVASEMGQGSVFSFILPAALAPG